jgi:putative lipoic acid-binding regulatory protein
MGPGRTATDMKDSFDADGPLGGRELELTYPCTWSYTVIGRDELRMRAAVSAIVGQEDHTVRHSHQSRTGKYRSLALDVFVWSNEQRLAIFAALQAHPDVRFVL